MKQEGGPAFPSQSSMRDDWFGMSLRDYFAAAALKGLMNSGWAIGEQTAHVAYEQADAMLAERDK